jgi:hypothetical protein
MRPFSMSAIAWLQQLEISGTQAGRTFQTKPRSWRTFCVLRIYLP